MHRSSQVIVCRVNMCINISSDRNNYDINECSNNINNNINNYI